ncbi:unnamed protein product [Closterium sp. NIES-64]|nr:unnamed protein product [Closterium sp. NIES-64]
MSFNSRRPCGPACAYLSGPARAHRNQPGRKDEQDLLTKWEAQILEPGKSTSRKQRRRDARAAGQEAPKQLRLMSRTDMVHYVDVTGGWDGGECAWCFDRAVAYRSEHALGKTSALSFLLHLHRGQSPAIPPAPPSRPSRAMLDFSWSVPVQRLGGQQGGQGGQQGVAPREQLVWKCEQAPLLCVQAMLLEWLAEPRVGVLMDLGRIRSRLPAILGYTSAAAHCSAPSAPVTSSAEASSAAKGGSAGDYPAAPAHTQPAVPAWSCCWRCSGCWAAYRRAVSFAAFLVLVARSPRVTTLWKTHMDRSETFTAIVTELGAGRHAQPDCFASMLVQVLGVKESADLQEGFGYFLQHLLPGGPEKAAGKGQEEGRGGTGKKAAALGNAGPAATAAMRLMGGGRGAEGIGGSSGVRGSGDEEDGGEGDGGRQGPLGGGGEGGGDGQGGQWREHLKGREWERYVDGMAWILEHGGGEGREFQCSHCSGGGSSSNGNSGSSCSSGCGGGSSSSSGAGGDAGGSSASTEGRDVPRGMYLSGVGGTDFALAVASVLSMPEHYEDQSLLVDGNNASKSKVENAAIYEARNRLRREVGERGRVCKSSGSDAPGAAATAAPASCSSTPSDSTGDSTAATAVTSLPSVTATTYEASQKFTAAAQSSAILAPGLVPVNTHPAMAVLTYRVACMLQWVRVYGSDFISEKRCFKGNPRGKVLPMRHPLRDLPSLLLSFGAIPKPLEGSGFSLEWDEWPHGDEAAVKFPDDPSARCFGLGIVGESGMGEERGTQSGSTEEREVTEESGAAEEGEQSSSEPVQRAVGKGKAGKGRGKRGKGGKSSGGKKVEEEAETITRRGMMGQGGSRQPRLPIIRCRADVDFLLALLGPLIMVPDCSHCIKCLGTFIYHVPCCALIANFAYQPVEALFARFLAAYPAHSPQFDQLFKALLLRAPLTVAEHIRLINEASPAGVRRGMSALRHRPERMRELPQDPGMRERVMLLKARQMPLFFLLGVAVYYSKPIMGMSDEEELVLDTGDGRKRGNGGRVGVVDGGEEGEEEEEDNGEVWLEVKSWGFDMLSAWRAMTKVMGPGLDVTCGKSSSSDVLPRKAGAPMSREWGVDMWAQAAKPRFREDMPAGQGGSGNDVGDSSRSGSSGSGGGKSEGEEEKGEEPAYLKPWPGGINLVACLREMLLGEVCYRPAPPSASSSHPAAPNASVSSGPAASSAPAAPSTDAAASNAAASVSVANGPGAAARGGRVCGAAGCGRVEGGDVKLRNCTGCGKMAYCNRECQKAHWPSHKLTCPGRTSGNKSGTNSGKA